MRQFLIELFSVLSRLANVLTGGIADMTFSARSHKDRLWTEAIIDALLGEGHCERWYWYDVERAKHVLEESVRIARHRNEVI